MSTKLTLNKTDATTNQAIVYPDIKTLFIPSNPEYIGGQRENVNARSTTDLSDFTGTPQELITKLGADFKAIKTPSYRLKNDGSYEEVPNCSFLVNSKNEKIIGQNITDRYSIFDFDNGILYYLSLLEEVKKKGLDVKPAYGQVWDDGAKMFLQYKVSGSNVLGEPMENYMSLVTSHDKTSGFQISLSMVRLFCKNQIHRMVKGASTHVSLRHSASNQARIAVEAEKMMQASSAQQAAMDSYLNYLASIKITDQDIYDAYGLLKNIESAESQRVVNTFSEQLGQLMACYNAPDVANFKGTALGAYYAFSDFSQHCKPARSTNDKSYIEAGLNGNEALAEFADYLEDLV